MQRPKSNLLCFESFKILNFLFLIHLPDSHSSLVQMMGIQLLVGHVVKLKCNFLLQGEDSFLIHKPPKFISGDGICYESLEKILKVMKVAMKPVFIFQGF